MMKQVSKFALFPILMVLCLAISCGIDADEKAFNKINDQLKEAYNSIDKTNDNNFATIKNNAADTNFIKNVITLHNQADSLKQLIGTMQQSLKNEQNTNDAQLAYTFLTSVNNRQIFQDALQKFNTAVSIFMPKYIDTTNIQVANYIIMANKNFGVWMQEQFENIPTVAIITILEKHKIDIEQIKNTIFANIIEQEKLAIHPSNQ